MKTVSPLSRRLVPWLALTSLAALVALILAPFFVPLAWAAVLAYASWPFAMWLRKKCGGRETVAAGMATLLVALMLILPLLWFAWLGKKELARVYPIVQAFIAAPPPQPAWLRSMPWLGDWLAESAAALLADPQDALATIRSWLGAHAGDAAALVGGVGRMLAKLVLTLTILFFFYRDGARIVGELRHVMVRYLGPQVHGYLAAAGATTRAVVYGILLTALAQGAIAGLGYWVAGLGSPVTLGVLTMLVALIPFATPLAWGGAGLWLLLQGEVGAAIGIWIWGAAVVSQLDNVLRPIFISSAGAIPFLLVLFGVLGGILAFGLVGLFAGPIVLAVGWAVWREWAERQEQPDIETMSQ